MIARLEPVISEMEREGESIVIVGHQAVLRVIFGYLMAQVGWQKLRVCWWFGVAMGFVFLLVYACRVWVADGTVWLQNP
jgi:broad specificity phosphatase PhoE